MAPLSNYLTLKYNFKMPMVLGLVLYISGQILAAFSRKIWQLILTQGILFGAGAGLVRVTYLPLFD
jgi:fucose permease